MIILFGNDLISHACFVATACWSECTGTCTYLIAVMSRTKPYGRLEIRFWCSLKWDLVAVSSCFLILLSCHGLNLTASICPGLQNFNGNPVFSAAVWSYPWKSLRIRSERELSSCLVPSTKAFLMPDQIEPNLFSLAIFSSFSRFLSGLYLQVIVIAYYTQD